MNNTVLLEIISPDKIFFSGQVRSIICPSEDGALGILPGHCPLIAHLKPGKVQVTDSGGKKEEFPIGGGFLQVHPHRVSIFTK